MDVIYYIDNFNYILFVGFGGSDMGHIIGSAQGFLHGTELRYYS